MKTVIIATGENPEMQALAERHPIPMLNLLDRPFIQHVVEYVVQQGLTEIDFLLSHKPEKFEGHLGDGTRWGAAFRYHLARDAARPFRTLKALRLARGDEPILVGFADRFARFDGESISSAPTVFCWRGPETEGHGEQGPPPRATGAVENATGAVENSAATATLTVTETSTDVERAQMLWAGWAILTGDDIDGLPEDLDENGFEEYILSRATESGRVVDVGRPLSLRSYSDLIESHCRVLSGEFGGVFCSGWEADNGVWLSRNVSIHPTARLLPPVYIGENCRIAIGAQIGPGAAVGDNCMLDGRCQVVNTVIAPGSYVGEGLELDHVIVDKNRLINTRLGADVIVPDSFLLGSISDTTLLQKTVSLLRRLAAVFFLVVMWPLLAATALALKIGRAGPVVYRKNVVGLPAQHAESLWYRYDLLSFQSTERRARTWLGDFFLNFLPGLINVARGDLSLVGLPTRTLDEIRALPEEWREFYLSCRAGLVNECDVIYDVKPTGEEAFAAEVYYSVKMGIQHDLKLLAGYFSRVLSLQRRDRRRQRSA